MNVGEIKSIITRRFPNVEQLRKLVFKAYSLHQDMPFAIWVFDCSGVIIRDEFDIHSYQDELLRDEFYRVAGPIQWNLYCYFLCDEDAFNDLWSRGVVQIVEGDHIYARKFVRTPKMLRDEFSSLDAINRESTSDIPIDVSLLWQNKLADQGLSVIFSSLSYAETVRIIKAGQDVEDTKVEEKLHALDTEPPIQFIDALDLCTFRHRPQVRQFVFGECNLFYGVNGSGKTSLFEGIEAWMCGRHRRNPDEHIESDCLKIQIKGVSDWQVGPVSNVAYYRERDHIWYGNYQMRRNELCFNFSRFNFYDSDAAARLEITDDDKEIETVLSRLIFGEVATRISERITRLLPMLEREERDSSIIVRDAEATISNAQNTIDSLEKPTESGKQAYKQMCAILSRFGWKGELPNDSADGCFKLLGSINDIAATIETIVSEISWIQLVSFYKLEKEKETIETCLIALEELAEQAKLNHRDKQELDVQMEANEKQGELLQRRIAFLSDGADKLIEMDYRQKDAQQSKASLVAASKEIERIDLSRYSEVSDTPEQMKTRIKSELDQKQQLSIEVIATVASLEAVHGRIEGLLSEIRIKAQELLEVDIEAKSCPVCGARYKKGELLKLVRRQVSQIAVPELQKAQTKLAQLKEEKEKLNSEILALEVLQSVSKDALGLKAPCAKPVKQLVSELMFLDKSIANFDVAIAQIQRDRKQLQAKGYTIEELSYLNESLELEFPDLSSSDKSALKKEVSEVAQKRSGIEKRLKDCLDESTKLRKKELKLLAQELGEEAASEDVKRRLNQVSVSIDRVEELKALVDLESSRPLPNMLLDLNSLRITIEGFIRLRQQEETVVRVVTESEKRIQVAQETVEKQKPIRERLRKAIAALEDIKVKHGMEKYVEQFFLGNLNQISDLFSMMHAPREFGKIVWERENAKAIRVIRKRDSFLCPVSKLSSGQRNALSLAIFLTMNRKIVKGPSIIMLDDPVAHVDDLNIVSFFDCLRELLLGCKRQIFFATASAKTANLFEKKFDYLGKDKFREFKLHL